MFFEGFTRTEIKTSGARIVTVHGGSGPPLLLMHGNPFSHLSWQKFAPRLAQDFTVVATDLRGYGDSEKPPGGDNHANYSFRTMAQDQIEVMAALGHEKFFAAGHDRGARVLHRMCLDHPDKVLRAAILDIVPQHHVFNHPNKAWATFSWHWFFMIQPNTFPRAPDERRSGFLHREEAVEDQTGLELLRSGGDRRVQALFPRSGDGACHVRGLPRLRRHRFRHGHERLRGRPQDRLPGAAIVGRDRRRRPQFQAEPGRGLAALRHRHPRRQGAALRTLSVGRGAG